MIATLQFRSLLTTILVVIASGSTIAQSSFWEHTEGPYGVSLWAALVTTNGTYYGGAGDGRIFRKLPGQDRWDIVLTSPGDILTLFEHNGKIYAGGANGLLVESTDNGATWQSIAAGLKEDLQVRDMMVNDAGDLFIGSSEGIYKRVLSPKTGGYAWELKPYTTIYGMFIQALCNTGNGVLYAGSGRGIYRSDDQGETWTLSGMGETANTTFDLAVNSNGDVYAGTSDQGLFVNYANDGQDNTWTQLATDVMSNKQARKISVIDGTKLFVSVSGSGLYYSENNTDWVKILNEDGRGGTFLDAVTDRIVTATMNGFWTSPHQQALSYTHVGLPLDISSLYAYRSKVIAMANNNTELYESSDQGDSWSMVFSNGEGRVTCYAEKDNEDRFVGCTGGFNGTPWISAYIYLDGLGARDWFSLGFPQSVSRINTVFITAKDSIYAGTNAGLYYIDTKTYNVYKLSSLASGVSILSLSENMTGDRLYASTNNGLWTSTDNGRNWSQQLSGIPVNGLALQGNEAYIATEQGLYHSSDPAQAPVLVNGLPAVPFTDVTCDDHVHLYATGNGTVYYAAGKNSTWVSQTEGVEDYGYAKLQVTDNQVYLSTSVGLHKHAYAEPAQITITGAGTFSFDGNAHGVTVTTVPAGLPVTIYYNGSTEAPVQGGTYRVTAVINDEQYAGKAYERIQIRKVAGTITLSGLGTRNYNGSPIAATATTVPAGLPVIITYNDKTDVPVEIGEYYVIAAIDHPSYQGMASGDLVIQDPVLGVEDPLDKLMSVYPVPTRTKVTVESSQRAIRSITVSDLTGSTVQALRFDTPVRSYDLETVHYPSGTLLLRIVTDQNESITRKVIITR